MSDLGSGRASNGGASRAPGPVPVSQPQRTPATIITPRDILRRREERERRLQSDAEAEARAGVPESRRRSQEERQAAASGTRPATGISPQIPPPTSAQPAGHARTPSSGQAQGVAGGSHQHSSAGASRPTNIPSSSQPIPQTDPSPRRPRVTSQSQGQPRPVAPVSGPGTQRAPLQQQAPAPGGQSQPRPTAAGPSTTARPPPASGHAPSASAGSVSSFPHAFERWETLSSHWEGLTSYWIHRLEQNNEELRREPMLQQLSRQVTDLSAAGANLFHAVVELQRLRASSERKFQRWFYETRKDTERQQEIAGQLQNTLVSEQQERANDAARYESMLEEAHSGQVNSQKLVVEMRRELLISKEEARRAWEELGRRVQEERDRTTALREGQPIVIGGIQVLPTAQQTTSKQEGGSASNTQSASARPVTRDGSSAPLPLSSSTQAQVSPTDTDPFTEHPPYRPPPTTNGHAVSAANPPTSHTSAPFYRQPNVLLHSGPPGSAQVGATSGGGGDMENLSNAPTEETFSNSELEEDEYEYDEYGRVRKDGLGRPIVYRRGLVRSDEEEDNDDEHHQEVQRQQFLKNEYVSSTAVSYPAIPVSSSSRITPQNLPHQTLAGPTPISGGPSESHSPGYANVPPADYEGGGFEGSWDSRVNYHPTRLSDVPEQDEDERSRVSEISGHSRRGMGPF